MSFTKTKDMLLVGLVTVVCTYMGNKVGAATDSIVELNASVKVLIERSESHKSRLEKLESAIIKPGHAYE